MIILSASDAWKFALYPLFLFTLMTDIKLFCHCLQYSGENENVAVDIDGPEEMVDVEII